MILLCHYVFILQNKTAVQSQQRETGINIIAITFFKIRNRFIKNHPSTAKFKTQFLEVLSLSN